MKALDAAKKLLLRILGKKAEGEEVGSAMVSAFQQEIARARSHEQVEREAAALLAIQEFALVPDDAFFILYPSTRGYPPRALGPFRSQEEAAEYIRIKRGRQRGSHQEYFSRNPGAPPRHDGDLFIAGEETIVRKQDVADIKAAEFAAIAAGATFDANLWEVETMRAFGWFSDSDGEAPRSASAEHAAPTLKDIIQVAVHSPQEALREGETPSA